MDFSSFNNDYQQTIPQGPLQYGFIDHLNDVFRILTEEESEQILNAAIIDNEAGNLFELLKPWMPYFLKWRGGDGVGDWVVLRESFGDFRKFVFRDQMTALAFMMGTSLSYVLVNKPIHQSVMLLYVPQSGMVKGSIYKMPVSAKLDGQGNCNMGTEKAQIRFQLTEFLKPFHVSLPDILHGYSELIRQRYPNKTDWMVAGMGPDVSRYEEMWFVNYIPALIPISDSILNKSKFGVIEGSGGSSESGKESSKKNLRLYS